MSWEVIEFFKLPVYSRLPHILYVQLMLVRHKSQNVPLADYPHTPTYNGGTQLSLRLTTLAFFPFLVLRHYGCIIESVEEWSSHYYLKQRGFTIIYSQIHFLCESIIALVRITRQRSLTETYNVGRCLKLKD